MVTFIHSTIAERGIIYNVSWEDPQVERERLPVGADDVVLTICSAGCNVLDYLVENPKAVVAADLNEAQLALLDLKLACLGDDGDGGGALTQAEFFALWGRSDRRVFDAHYAGNLRARLRRDASVAFWDANGVGLFDHNLMYVGTSGLMAALFALLARLTGNDRVMARKLAPSGSAGGADGGDANGPGGWSMRAMTALIASPRCWAALAPLGGVPPEQLSLVARRPRIFAARVAEILRSRMWRADNYFYHGYVCGQFSPDCCPRYMSVEHYGRIVGQARRVTLHHGTLGNAAETLRADWSVVSILDSMDWMPPDVVAGFLRQLLPRCAPRAKIFWRSFGPGPSLAHGDGGGGASTFTAHSGPLAQLLPAELVDSCECIDRVGWCVVGRPPSADVSRRLSRRLARSFVCQ